MSKKYLRVMIALVATTPSLLAAQATVPTRTLTRAEVELTQAFSRLTGVRELSDGRVIVADMQEKQIALVDLTRKTSTKIGSEGVGPGEYTMPTAVMAMPADTTLVSDRGSKYIKIAPDGRIAGEVRLPQGYEGAMLYSFGGIGANVDAAGHIYIRGVNFGRGSSAIPTAIDTAPITRFNPRSNIIDTVAYVKMQHPQIASQGGGGSLRVNVRPGVARPFVGTDAWAVAPDGRIALVSAEPYRVTWLGASGQRTVGQPITYERVRVTDAEKQAYRDAQAASPPSGSGRASGAGTQFTEPDSWPEFKHPFSPTVMVSPSGELWILRQQAHTVKTPTFDIVGARGELTGRVVIPEKTRLLGFGKDGAVYLARRDADDLEYIQRYRLSAGR